MKKSLFILLACLLLFVSPLSSQEAITVLAFNYPPIYQQEDDKGLACEIVIEAFKAADVTVELQFLPVTRMVSEVSSGRAVCGIGGKVLFSDSDVAGKVTISEPIMYVAQGFLYNSRRYPEGITYSKLPELDKYAIGVLSGSGIMRFLQASDAKLHLVPNVSHSGTAKQLHAERVDLWAIVDLTGKMYMKKLFPETYNDYVFAGAFHYGDVSVVFSKSNDPEHIYYDKFTKGLRTIKKNGTYARIFTKYYGADCSVDKQVLADDMR